jgi:CheY-like chemotaxis protein
MLPTVIADRPATTIRSLAVLIADDMDENRQMLRHWLEERGHVVYCASSGNEAIRIANQERLDLVITEIIMPNGDGLELIIELRKRQPAARIIALSAGGRYMAASDCLHVAKGLGAHETLLKPAPREDLFAAIDRVTA